MKARKSEKIITSYKPILLFLDFGTLLFSFGFSTLVLQIHLADHNFYSLATIFLVLAAIFISYFWAFDLYSYNANFTWEKHFKNIIKALAGCLACLSLLDILILWNVHFFDRFIITCVAAFLIFLLLVRRSNETLLTTLASAVALSMLTVVTFEVVDEKSLSILKSYKSFIPIIFGFSSGLIVICRYFEVSFLFNGWMRKIFRWKMVIIGSDEEAKRITNYIIKHDAPFYVKGYVTSNAAHDFRCNIQKKCLGKVTDLPEIATRTEIDDIVITDENIDKDLLLQILEYSIEQRLNIWFLPKLLPIISIKIHPDCLCGLPMIKLCTQKRNKIFNRIKNGLDALIALPIFILQLPFFGIIALAVRSTSEGSVFFKPDMIGKNANIFKMYKFRSMCAESSCEIHKEYVTKLIRGEIGQKGIDGQILKIVDDPRITSVGRILRKFSLDELPQLLNVLKGEMSLVGPRPCTTYEFEHYEEWHKKRVSVLPGITGLWQVCGRSEVSFEDMILLDLYYIYNRSLLLDLRILYETVFAVLRQKGAY